MVKKDKSLVNLCILDRRVSGYVIEFKCFLNPLHEAQRLAVLYAGRNDVYEYE